MFYITTFVLMPHGHIPRSRNYRHGTKVRENKKYGGDDAVTRPDPSVRKYAKNALSYR